MRLRIRLIDALVVLELKRALPRLSECLVGVGDSLGADVAGGSPVGDFLPVGPGEYPGVSGARGPATWEVLSRPHQAASDWPA